MKLSAAINYGIATGTIQKPELISINDTGDEILEWVGSEQPTAEVLAAAWEAYGGDNALQDETTKVLRAERFRAEADPLFFQVQRGEVEQSVYDAKVAQIRADLPLTTD